MCTGGAGKKQIIHGNRPTPVVSSQSIDSPSSLLKWLGSDSWVTNNIKRAPSVLVV